jgi:hypothetical protein
LPVANNLSKAWIVSYMAKSKKVKKKAAKGKATKKAAPATQPATK